MLPIFLKAAPKLLPSYDRLLIYNLNNFLNHFIILLREVALHPYGTIVPLS